MSAWDGLAPPMTAAERAVVKAWGSWTEFMQSYGLRPYEDADVKEAYEIVRAFAAQDEEDRKTGHGNGGNEKK